MGIGLVVSCISILWVLAEGELARRNGMLTAAQMIEKHPLHQHGLPFIWHFGMWGDLFIITPIVGVIIAMYSNQWNVRQIVALLAVGMALSGVMHWMYAKGRTPDSLIWREGVSAAGWLHILYMGLVFAILGLLFLCTANLSARFVILVSLLLLMHVAIGNHIVLGWLALRYHFGWCPDLIHIPAPWVTFVATFCVLAGLTGWVLAA